MFFLFTLATIFDSLINSLNLNQVKYMIHMNNSGTIKLNDCPEEKKMFQSLKSRPILSNWFHDLMKKWEKQYFQRKKFNYKKKIEIYIIVSTTFTSPRFQIQLWYIAYVQLFSGRSHLSLIIANLVRW